MAEYISETGALLVYPEERMVPLDIDAYTVLLMIDSSIIKLRLMVNAAAKMHGYLIFKLLALLDLNIQLLVNEKERIKKRIIVHWTKILIYAEKRLYRFGPCCAIYPTHRLGSS